MDEFRRFKDWMAKYYPDVEIPLYRNRKTNSYFIAFQSGATPSDVTPSDVTPLGEAPVGGEDVYYDEKFGVIEDGDNVVMPDGTILTKTEWDSLDDKGKLGYAHVSLRGNYVYYLDDNGDIKTRRLEDVIDIENEEYLESDLRGKLSGIYDTLIETKVVSGTPTTPTTLGGLAGTAAGLTDEERKSVEALMLELNIPYEEALERLGLLGAGGDDLARERFEWEKERGLSQQLQADWQRQTDYQLSQQEISANYAAQLQDRLMQREESDWEKASREQQDEYEKYEAVRQEMIAKYENKPTAWIKKYQYETAKNPNVSVETPEQTEEEWAKQTQGQIDYWKYELDKIEDMIGDRGSPAWDSPELVATEKWLKKSILSLERTQARAKAGIPVGGSTWADTIMDMNNPPGFTGEGQASRMVGDLSLSYQEAVDLANKYALNPNDSIFKNFTQAELSALKGMVSDMGGIMTPTGAVPWQNPTLTPQPLGMPSWLQSGVEGSPTTVSMTSPAEALTPSGQWWGRLAPAQQEMWGGYAEHAGQRPQDLLWGTQAMLPKDLRLGKTWKSF